MNFFKNWNSSGWKYGASGRVLLFVAFVALFYLSLAPVLLPKKYDLRSGIRSDVQIKAPMQVQNMKETLKAQEKEAEKVQKVYRIVALRNELVVDQIFARINSLQQEDQLTISDKIKVAQEVIPNYLEEHIQRFIETNSESAIAKGASSSKNVPLSKSFLAEIHRVMVEQYYTIPPETYIKLARVDPEELSMLKAVSRKIVEDLMNEQITDARTVRPKVAEEVNRSSLSRAISREIVQEITRYVITANKFYDEEATKQAQAEAKESTPPVFIKQGEELIKKGEMITMEMYDLIERLNLVKKEVNYLPHAGVLLMALLLSTLIYLYIRYMNANKFKFHNGQMLMLLLIYAINLVVMYLIRMAHDENQSYMGFLAPIAMGTMLVTLLLDISLAYISAIIFSLLSSVIFNLNPPQIFDFRYGFVGLSACFASIFTIHKASQRSAILKSGIMVCLFSTSAVMVLKLVGSESLSETENLRALGFGLASGLLTAILVIGLMPFFEVIFGILSALKLVELSNPNHPLLRKLLRETPGTYHHSVMVGNISESAAEAIGANGLLCRVGSFYHDIGKTLKPSYFIENQSNIANPHDSLDPKTSTSIITAHARDGAEMLKEYNIPKPIRDIAEQHHGTTLLKFFYFKAMNALKEQGLEPNIDENEYRYPGPKAQSKEAAIVGVSDCVEAAVRSLRNPSLEQIENLIAKIIKDRLDDHQFNECDLTLRELDIIAQSLKETVIGIFHSRIEYPDVDKGSKS